MEKLALTAGFEVSDDVKFLMVTGGGIDEIGKEFFFSTEKLTTMLALFKYKGEFQNAIDMVLKIFNVGGKEPEALHEHHLGFPSASV